MLIHPHPHSYSCPPLYRYSHIPIHHYHHRKELRKHWSINAMAGTGDYPHPQHPHHPHHHDHKVAAVVYQRRARASDREPKSRERRPASLLCCNHLYIVHTCIGRTIQVKEMNRNDARNLCTCCKGQAYASTRTNKASLYRCYVHIKDCYSTMRKNTCGRPKRAECAHQECVLTWTWV